LLELRNIATVAELIVQCALLRPESRGLNYNLDFPDANPEWAQRDSVVRKFNLKKGRPAVTAGRLVRNVMKKSKT
jgi:aspartate oxidase